jgi:uncharacterized protein (TIGR02231 family)
VSEVLTVANGSRATQVTFYEDRARVIRVATALVGAGHARVRVLGVSPFVDERSIEASVAVGEARVLAASAHWSARAEGAATREDVEALEAKRVEADRALALARAAYQREIESRARVQALTTDQARALAQVPLGVREPERLASFVGAWTALTNAEREALEAIDHARREVATLEDALALASARLAEASVREPRLEAAIDVQLETPRASEITLEIAYRLPCALWRPEHIARLADEGETGVRKATLEIVTLATLWQRTGEAWEGVEVALSTARPAREASPPLLTEDVLRSQKKAPEMRKKVVVQSREEEVKTAGLERERGEVSEMPGVDDGGEPLHYSPTTKVTLRSDGRPVRVEIARTSLDADVASVVRAELSAAAHLRATATLARGGPLLAGPLRLARNATLVGRAKLDFVGKGEPFEVGFGADDAIRVKRRMHETRDTTAILGTQKVRRHVALFFSNLSDAHRSFEVVERLPVSEIEGLEVELVDDDEAPARAWKLDPKTGFATSKLSLDGGATAVLKLAYELRAASNVVLGA